MDVKSIVLIGVGGQGTILVSKVLTTALMHAGYDVKMSEIHGMAQRGGSVSTQVRYGTDVHSPLVGRGGADILVAFERMEALRGLDYLKPDGIVVMNDYKIVPPPVASGKATYPEHIIEKISEKTTVIAFNAGEEAIRLGNPRVMNIVLLGAMAEAFEMEDLDWDRALKETIPERFIDLNLKAFRVGREMAKQAVKNA